MSRLKSRSWWLQQPALGARAEYWRKVKELFGSGLIAYWPLWEASGTAAEDVSGHVPAGVHTNVTPGQAGIGDGKKAASYNGTSAYTTVYKSELSALFGAEGFLFAWAKMLDASVWADTSSNRSIFQFSRADFGLPVRLYKSTTANQLNFEALGKSAVMTPAMYFHTAGWFCVGITWSQAADRMRAYYNGRLLGQNTALSLWDVSTLGRALVGAGTTGAWFHKGSVAHVVCGNRQASESEAARFVNLFRRPVAVSGLGDSIMTAARSWLYQVCGEYREGLTTLKNHAASGAHVMPDHAENLDKQVSEAASDRADVIILALGTNDNNGGDMGALQAKVEAGIDALRASNPGARLYYMNVLPRFDGVNVSAIRTAIAAACAAKGVPCWDTFTVPWIVQADTLDNLHPNAAGHAKIAAEVLARL